MIGFRPTFILNDRPKLMCAECCKGTECSTENNKFKAKLVTRFRDVIIAAVSGAHNLPVGV